MENTRPELIISPISSSHINDIPIVFLTENILDDLEKRKSSKPINYATLAIRISPDTKHLFNRLFKILIVAHHIKLKLYLIVKKKRMYHLILEYHVL